MKKAALKLPIIALVLMLSQTPFGAAHAQDREYKKRESAVEKNMTFARRLKNIAAPIRIKFAKACGNMVAPFIGAEFATTDSVGENYQLVMQNLYGTTLYPTITMIGKHSPAAENLQIGDVITHVNAIALTKGQDSLIEIKDYIRKSKNVPLMLSVQRGDTTQDITVKPVTACSKPVRLVSKNDADIFVDDTKIGVTKGILESSATNEDISKKIEEALFNSLN
ncbi:MAG: PDZ domain-containing protein [Alphaproteobacteria bacterium]|nr:PDZ domain-containing protein [Alphaproteobacteria bacterium]